MSEAEVKFKVDTKTRAYNFALDLINLINKLDQNNSTNKILCNQVLRSGTSIGANIIEAQAGRTKKDFGNFFTHALKSANETKFWLNLLKDAQIAPVVETNKLIQEVTELANILAASIITLKGH